MKRINKIIILFLLLVTILLSLAWKFIQSEQFAKILINKVDEKLSAETGAEIDFEKIELRIFPPATVLKNVKFTKVVDASIQISIDAESLVLDFGVSSFFTSKFTAEKISVKQGNLKLIHPEINISKLIEDFQKEGHGEKFKVEDIFNFYSEQVYKPIKSRIRKLGLENIHLELNNDQIFLEQLQLELEKSYVRVKLDLQNPKLENTKGLEGIIPDDLSFHADIYKSVLLIDNLLLKSKFEKLFLKGRVFGSQDVNIVVTGEYSGILDNLNKRVDHELTRDLSGDVSLKLAASGLISNPLINIEARIHNINSNFFSIDDLEALCVVDQKIFKVKQLQIKKRNGEIRLKKEFDFIDLEKKKIILSQINVGLKNYFTNDALKSIASSMDPFKGYMTGDVEILYEKGSFLFILKPSFTLDSFQLVFEQNQPILKNRGFSLGGSELLLDQNLNLGLDLKFKFPKGHLDAKGTIDSMGIDITSSRAHLDLEEFGAISGIELKGKNDFKLHAIGPWNDVRLNIDGTIETFSLLGFYLPQFNYKASYEINNARLDLPMGEAKLQNGLLQAEGEINFLSKSPLNLAFTIDKMDLNEAKRIMNPIMSLIPWTPHNAYLNIDAAVSLNGGFEPHQLDVKADFHADKMKINLETFDKMDFSLGYKLGVLSISDFILKKKKGLILGKLDLKSGNDFYVSAKINEMKLEDFEYYRLLGLGLESSLNGSLEFKRKSGVDQSTLDIFATEGKIASIFVPDSNFRLDLDQTKLKVAGSLFAGDVKLNSLFNISKEDKSSNSEISVVIKTQNIKNLLGIFASHNVLERTLDGGLDLEAKAKLNPYFIHSASAEVTLNNFNLKRDEFSIKALNTGKIISISDGKVNHFDLALDGGGNLLNLIGTGKFNQNFLISGNSKISASIIEFVTDKITDVKGFLSSRFNLSWTKDKFSNFVELQGEDVSFVANKISSNFSNVNFKSTLNNDDFYLRSLKGEIGGGKFEAKGEAKLTLPFPILNFSFNAFETNLPVLERSKIVTTSRLTLKGQTPPYQVEGTVNLLYGLIEDDVEKILAEKYKDKKFERYIPKGVFTEGGQLFNFNVGINSDSEIRIVNSLMDIGLKGKIQVIGGLENMQTMGELLFIPVTSKIKFRGHEFIIDSGFIEIEETNKQTESNLKLSALSNIDQYSIKMDISSIGDEVQISLSSSPPLAQEDILSLLTLGYTSDINKKLTEGDRQSVASVGVGSLLVERFKLGETLNSSFGLQLSVAPEFGEAAGSMLQSSQGAQTPTNQLKSATKISVRKKINKRLGLSLSSTVGGSLDQKQEMNVDFDINKSWTIQGIYEVKEVDDDSNADPNSMGFDLRWRHTTK